MKIYRELSIAQFEAWSGGEILQQKIIDNGKEDEFENLIEVLYPDGISDSTLNEELRDNDKWWMTILKLKNSDEDEESEEMKC